MSDFKVVIEPIIKKLRCKNCGKEVIVTDNGKVEQTTITDYVIKEQFCEDCGCNFYEVESSMIFK